MGAYFLASKEEEQTLKTKAVRIGSIAFLVVTFIIFVALVFSDNSSEYQALSDTIGPRCDSN